MKKGIGFRVSGIGKEEDFVIRIFSTFSPLYPIPETLDP
jgi:hypothetical protein